MIAKVATIAIASLSLFQLAVAAPRFPNETNVDIKAFKDINRPPQEANAAADPSAQPVKRADDGPFKFSTQVKLPYEKDPEFHDFDGPLAIWANFTSQKQIFAPVLSPENVKQDSCFGGNFLLPGHVILDVPSKVDQQILVKQLGQREDQVPYLLLQHDEKCVKVVNSETKYDAFKMRGAKVGKAGKVVITYDQIPFKGNFEANLIKPEIVHWLFDSEDSFFP